MPSQKPQVEALSNKKPQQNGHHHNNRRFPIRTRDAVLVIVTMAMTLAFRGLWLSPHDCSQADNIHSDTLIHAREHQMIPPTEWKVPKKSKGELSSSSTQKDASTSTSTSASYSALDILSDYKGPSRAFEPFQGPFPCYSSTGLRQSCEPASDGILFQRPYKVGSTTVAGMVMRLAHNRYEQRLRESPETFKPFQYPYCEHRSNHGSGVNFEFAKRNRTRSFLFSLIRHPDKRALSEFFHFKVSVRQEVPTDEAFRNFFQNRNQWMMRDLSLRPLEAPRAIRNYTKVVEEILDDYDFLAVTERLDESLVAIKMLLNLDLRDILYLRSRSSGSFSNGPPEVAPCVYIMKSFVSPGTKAYLESKEWKDKTEGDVLLHKAALASLDRTIDETLGRAEFNHNLELFQRALKKAAQLCQGKMIGMCSEGGAFIPPENRTCYIWGEGCDHVCLNEISTQFSVEELTA